ncbi:class I SAM-dependent methyltransferase [Algoriphagus sp.]|uniref:class I SAM-dependent methyltransferase n=1 Tax=Algoriphagus sp. TaxID=1872435 RepID=UPI00391DDFC3
MPESVRKVSDITRFSTSGIKFANLYRYFCSLTPAENVIELGTCVGISTRYLSTKTIGQLYTLEGSSELQMVAMREPKPSNTEFVLGQINTTLPQILDQIQKLDFALIDANHTYEGTIFAFNTLLRTTHSKTIFAIGDIHWSLEMEKAWSEIKLHPEVKLTFDFYECGIVFFDYTGEKTDLILDI